MQEKSKQKVFFWENLRFLVNKTGLHDSHVAAAIGIHKVSFSRYFAQQRVPKRSVLAKMSDFFGVSIDDLLAKDLSSAESTAKNVPLDAPSLPVPESALASSRDFAAYVFQRTAELQAEVNRFAADLLNKYNQLNR